MLNKLRLLIQSHIFDGIMTNRVQPDQLASGGLDLHCLQRQGISGSGVPGFSHHENMPI